MASWWTNRAKSRLTTAGVNGRVMRLLLVDTPPASAAAAADLNVVSDVVADELAGTGYARVTLAGVAVAEDDANDRATLDATDPATYAAINAGTIAGAWVFERVGGGDVDANDHLWLFLDCSDLVTNGGDVNLAFHATGLSTIT